MAEIILQVIIAGGAFVAGYGVCKLRTPTQKRGANGRFVKK